MVGARSLACMYGAGAQVRSCADDVKKRWDRLQRKAKKQGSAAKPLLCVLAEQVLEGCRGADREAGAGVAAVCSRFLELCIDLLSTLPTRRFYLVYLTRSGFVHLLSKTPVGSVFLSVLPCNRTVNAFLMVSTRFLRVMLGVYSASRLHTCNIT